MGGGNGVRLSDARPYDKSEEVFSAGSRGVLYCSSTGCFTTPFIATSGADPRAVVKDIWPEPWVLPFDIEPLGDPSRQLRQDQAWERWPILIRRQDRRGGATAAMNGTGVTVFVPVDIANEDWEAILRDLASPSDQTDVPFVANSEALSSNESDAELWEGGRISVLVNRYERDPKARKACLELFGTSCSVCDLQFSDLYGEIGRGYIHIHHLRPLATLGKSYRIDPRKDLRPVCPNCHEMLHTSDPPLPIDELKSLLRRKRLG